MFKARHFSWVQHPLLQPPQGVSYECTAQEETAILTKLQGEAYSIGHRMYKHMA